MTGRMKVVFVSLSIVLFLIFSFVKSLPDGRLHVVFCNVGQGDAIYLKFPDGTDGVIDGGPGKKVLSCLGSHMQFWDRKIEFVILTHPHEDHFKGLIEVLKRYKVSHVIVPAVGNSESEFYKSFEESVRRENAQIRNLYQGDYVEFKGQRSSARRNDTIVLKSLWPEKRWVAENGEGVLNQNILGAETSYNDLNDFSQVILMSYGNFDVLFTGDAEEDLLEKIKERGLFEGKSIEVLKVPHQGNKQALTRELVSYLHPKLGIIFVGKNSYGHPDISTIQLLSEAGALVKRTDKDGEVEVISDGEEWSIR